MILSGLLWPLRSSFCSFGPDDPTDVPQEGGPLLSLCPKLAGQRSCHCRIPKGYEARVFLLHTDDQHNFLNSSIIASINTAQFTPTDSGYTGTFSLPPTFYPLAKRGLPCQIAPSLTVNFLLGLPDLCRWASAWATSAHKSYP